MKVPLLPALFILFILSVFSAPKGKATFEKSATKRQIAPILSNSEVSLACTKGTPLGDQLENALNYCEKVDKLSRQIGKNGKGKGKAGKGKSGKGKGKTGKGKGGKGKSGKGKGKSGKGKGNGGKKCPSVNNVLGKLESKAKKDLCVFDILGWVNENGKVIKDVMESAIKSLPTEVAIEMSLEKIVTCATNKANDWALRPKRQRCDGTYDPTERKRLDQYEANVAGMKCLKTVMSATCRIFINKPTAAETIPLPISPGFINKPTAAETIPLPISPGFQKPIVNGPGGLASTEEGGSSEQVGSSKEDGSSEEKGSSEEEGSSEEGGFSLEGGSSHSGGYSQEGISSHESGPSHSGGYSNEESSSQEGGSNYGHGGHGSFNPGNIGNLPYGWGPGNFPIGGPLPFPILPDYTIPGFGRPPIQGVPGNFQQVIVESPNYPPPYLPAPSHSLPERWPSNLVAAFLPADWLAENFGESDDDDEYDYEYEEYDDTEYEYEDYYGEDNEEDYYGEDYGEDYVDDYYEDSTEAPSNAVQAEAPSAAVAVPLPLALSEEPELNTEPTDSPVAA